MRFCTQCGAQLPDAAKFCTKCGKKVPEPVSAAPAPQAPSAPAYQAPAAPVYEAPVVKPVEEEATQYVAPAYVAPKAPVVEEEATQYVASAYVAPKAPVVEKEATQYVTPAYAASQQPAYQAPAQPAYQAPAQPAYQSPAKPAYQAPAQPQQPARPAAPQGGSVTPPPAAPAKAQKKAKKKGKGGLIALICAVVLALGLVAFLLISLLCGGAKKDAAELGLYNVTSIMEDGDEVELNDEWIELLAKGKAKIAILDDEYDAKWEIDGTDFTLKQAGDEYTGTLEDGVLTLDISGIEYTFVKEGMEDEEAEEDKEDKEDKEDGEEEGKKDEDAAAPALPAEVGYWTLSGMEQDGQSVGEDEIAAMKEMGIEIFLVLYEDGTGVLQAEEAETVTWGDGQIVPDSSPEEPASYVIEDGVLSLEADGMVMKFARGEGEAPEVELPADEPAAEEAPAVEEPAAEAIPEPEPEEEPVDSAMLGYWVIARMEEDGVSVNEEEIAMMKEAGVEVFLELYADGTGILQGEETLEMVWGDGVIYPVDEPEEPVAIYLDGDELVLENDNEAMIFVREGAEPSEEQAAAANGFEMWEGDWYGWWIVLDATGSYVEFIDNYWDAYATIDVDGDFGTFTLWDHSCSKSEPAVVCDVVFDSYGATDWGTMISLEGTFLDDDILGEEWYVDPGDSKMSQFENMLVIEGVYQDPANSADSFEYVIFLRPWGQEWDDVEAAGENPDYYDDMMPGFYYDWYLPLLEMGYEMPDSYEEGLEIIEASGY